LANPKAGERIFTDASEHSGWVLALKEAVKKAKLRTVKIGGLSLQYFTCTNSLWLIYSFNQSGHIALRTCYDPAGVFKFSSRTINSYTTEFIVHGNSGVFKIKIENFKNTSILKSKCCLVQKGKLRLTYLPRDVYALGKDLNPLNTEGIIHTGQHGPCSGIVFFSLYKPEGGSALYFQNLTALNKYCVQTKTEPFDCVGGLWPEMGTALPVCEDNCITTGSIILSDVFLNFSECSPRDEFDISRLYLDMLSEIYLALPKPSIEYYDWPKTAQRTLKTLSQSKHCYRLIANKYFLNAYTDTNDKPPESMVQLSVVVPMIEYCEWSGSDAKIILKIKRSLEYFYSKRLKTIVRWLPMATFKKSIRSEEEYHNKMDSWYHLHILLNLGRLAAKGDSFIKSMFFKSIDYAIKVAHTFKYQWPVFYDMSTLRIIKNETEPGKGGELDVPGIYAHVMLQAYELTKDNKYLMEAEQAAKKLKGMSLHLVYQTNITIFNSVALARLWEITGNKLYLDLSILCAANVINRFWIWSCKYGYAKSYETFMGMLPLHDAKYLALYEESEAMAAMYKLVSILRDKAPESLRILIAEYMKYLLHRGKYFYPENLPDDVLSEKIRNGKLYKELCIPIEDLQHGWEKSGQVGQEVYGAAAPFIFVSCAYRTPDKLPFSIYCNYPVYDIQFEKKAKTGRLLLTTGGMESLKCAIRILPNASYKIKNISVSYRPKNRKSHVKALRKSNEYVVTGNSDVEIKWI
jgi:hypothetical protein